MKIINKILVKRHIKKPPEKPCGDNKSSVQLPPPIAERLKEEKLNIDNLIFYFKSDMNSSALYSDTYILFDKDGVYIADFNEEVKEKKTRKRKTKKIEA